MSLPRYFSNHATAFKPLSSGGTLMLVDKKTFQSGDPNNPTWEVTDVWQGHPTVIVHARDNPSIYFDHPSWIKDLSTKEKGPIWEAEVKYGNIELLSTWTLDSNMIEHFVDYHKNNLNDRIFNFRQVQMIDETMVLSSTNQGSKDEMDIGDSGLIRWHKPLPNGAYVYTTGYSIDELNYFASEYAKAWLLGQDAYQEPQWVIRNEVTVTAAFNLDAGFQHDRAKDFDTSECH